MNKNYLVTGNDEYIREKEVSKIKEKFLSGEEAELNYSAYNPEDIIGIMDSLGTMPFLAENRVVLVKESQALSDTCADTILLYLENPSENSVLILSSDDSHKKNKRYKKLSSLMEVVRADKPTPQTIKSWVRAFFKKENVDITPEAVDLIGELKGQDTSGIKAELDKLIGYSGGERIEVKHVEDLVGRSVTETVFKLVDAINGRDPKWVLRVLRDLYDQKKQPPEIIGYLGWYIRVIQKIVLLRAKGMDIAGIASEVGYSAGYVRRLSGQAKKYSIKRINRWIDLLLTTDRDIKTGQKQGDLALEMLLVSLVES